MIVPKCSISYRNPERRIDLDFSFCYNSFRIIFGKMGLMEKMNKENQIITKEDNVDIILEKYAEIKKENETSKRHMATKYTELMTNQNVSEDIKYETINMAKEQRIYDAAIKAFGITAASIVAIYAVNALSKCYIAKKAT